MNRMEFLKDLLEKREKREQDIKNLLEPIIQGKEQEQEVNKFFDYLSKEREMMIDFIKNAIALSDTIDKCFPEKKEEPKKPDNDVKEKKGFWASLFG